MLRTLVQDLGDSVDQDVTVCGWINTLRLQRKMQFVLIRDHTGTVQVTHQRGGPDDEIEATLESVSIESAVIVTGRVVRNEIVNLGGIELIPRSVEVVNRAESPLPIDENSSLENRLDWRFLDLRRPASRVFFEVETTVEAAMRKTTYDEGFLEIHTPKLMGTASESGAEVFPVEYFGRTAYLAQSPQFYKQMALAAGLDKFFEIGPVFRAEPSFTSRHATEFTGVDAEFSWIDSVEDVMAFEERLLANVIECVEHEHGQAIADHFGVELRVPELPFPRITMADALELLRKDGWDPDSVRADLDPEGERALSARVREMYGHDFVYVTEFPVGVRPFYHLRPAHDPTVTASFDLLWNGIEITTGAQREHRYDVLVQQAEEKGMELEPLQGYLNSFRYGMPPHGGLGFGLNRFMMVLLGLDSIREAGFLFRGPNRLEP